MIAVVDYGAGNLASVANALRRLSVDTMVTSEAGSILDADGVILPGVGAAADTMRHLNTLGLSPVIREVIDSGRPFLGICMGMQALMTHSLEGGDHACLDVVPGTVRRLPSDQIIPHMGWNQVHPVDGCPLFEGIPRGAEFYFVHSYYVDPLDPTWTGAVTEYGLRFASVFARENLMATQFHPEKSGRWGLHLLNNFARIVSRAAEPVGR